MPDDDDDIKKYLVTAEAITNILQAFAKYGFFAFAAYCAWQAIDAIAGKTTVFDFVIGWFTGSGSGLTVSISITFGTVMSVWAILERRARLRKTKSLGDQVRTLELVIDENRTTSGLLSDGTTNPKDK